MAINLVVNGISYTFPTVNDVNWGQQVTSWATAITNGTLQKTGGTFQLLGEVDFGTSHGLKSLYYKSRAAIPASAGEVRLGNTEQILWRDAGDTADLGISLDVTGTLVTTAPLSVPALTTTGTVTTSLTTGLVKSASGVLGSSLLVDADVSVSAAVARSKLASGTADHVVINDSSGLLSSEAALSPVRGGTGQTSVTTGDILYGASSNVIGKLPIGSAAQVLTVTGGVPTWENVPAGFADPMTTAGDLIFKNASTVTTRLPVGAINTVLASNGTVPTYTQVTSAMIADATIVDADISSGAAIALTKLATGGLPTGITVSSSNIVDGTIVNADINASANIAGSKIQAAGVSNAGVVTTGAQTFEGIKVFNAQTFIANSTISSSPTTGALVVTGGVGVGGDLHVQGEIVNKSGVLELGGARTSAGSAYIDLTTETGSPNYNARFVRYVGTNGGIDLLQTGTGAITITNAAGTSTGVGTLIQGYRAGTPAAGYVGETMSAVGNGADVLVTPTYSTAVTLSNVTPGIWQVRGQVFLNNGSAEYRPGVFLSVNGATQEHLGGFVQTRVAAGNGVSMQTGSLTVVVTSTSTITLRVRSEINDCVLVRTLTDYNRIDAVRIA